MTERSSTPGRQPWPGDQTCRFCNGPLDRHQAARNGVCGSVSCERQRSAELAVVVERGKRQRAVELQKKVMAAAAAELDAAAQDFDVPRDDLLIGVVPHQDGSVGPLPTDRRAALEAHLDRIASVGFARAGKHAGAEEAAMVASDGPEPPIAEAGCATCQGACCVRGGENMAFLTEREVVRYRSTDSTPTPEGFKARYLAFLPDTSVVGACVFQAPTGCSIPRDHRAQICNRFHCEGLTMLLRDASVTGATKVAIVAHNDGVPMALGLFDHEDSQLKLRDVGPS